MISRTSGKKTGGGNEGVYNKINKRAEPMHLWINRLGDPPRQHLELNGEGSGKVLISRKSWVKGKGGKARFLAGAGAHRGRTISVPAANQRKINGEIALGKGREAVFQNLAQRNS